MSIKSSQADILEARVARHAAALMELVRTRHPEAQFHGPTYWPDERLWVIEAFFDHGEDFELEAHLAQSETDILLEEGVWMCLIPLPLQEARQ